MIRVHARAGRPARCDVAVFWRFGRPIDRQLDRIYQVMILQINYTCIFQLQLGSLNLFLYLNLETTTTRAGFAVATFPRLGKVLVRGQATDGIAHRPGEWRRRGACPPSRCRAQPSKRIAVRAPCSRRRPHRSGETERLCGHAPERGADAPERALDRMPCRCRSMAGPPYQPDGTGRQDATWIRRPLPAGISGPRMETMAQPMRSVAEPRWPDRFATWDSVDRSGRRR